MKLTVIVLSLFFVVLINCRPTNDTVDDLVKRSHDDFDFNCDCDCSDGYCDHDLDLAKNDNCNCELWEGW